MNLENTCSFWKVFTDKDLRPKRPKLSSIIKSAYSCRVAGAVSFGLCWVHALLYGWILHSFHQGCQGLGFVGLVCQSADLTTFEMMSHISESLTRLCPCWTTERNVSLSKSIRVRSRRALSDDSSMLLGIVTEDTLHT